MTVKQCPILIHAGHKREDGYLIINCIEEDCAWWNEYFGCCGLVAQGQFVGGMVTREERDED